jgi:hypothetical protein
MQSFKAIIVVVAAFMLSASANGQVKLNSGMLGKTEATDR